MENELVIVDNNQAVVATDMFQLEPVKKMEYAAKIANVLSDIIEKQKLFTKIGPSKHVNIEGWATLGTILGILPKENRVVKIDNGYEAHVDLVRVNDGIIVGGASSICTRSERTWAKREEYAIRSMAITRATGKAYRLAFAWIINLAGYSGTPLEEMPTGNQAPQYKSHGFNSNIESHKQFLFKEHPKTKELDRPTLEKLYKQIHGKTGDEITKIVEAI